MNARDGIYIRMLEFGLINIRAAAQEGHLDLCEAEADHLHNIPSLIGETREGRHEYYYDAERPAYLEKIERMGEKGRAFALDRYQELWPELAKALKRTNET